METEIIIAARVKAAMDYLLAVNPSGVPLSELSETFGIIYNHLRVPESPENIMRKMRREEFPKESIPDDIAAIYKARLSYNHHDWDMEDCLAAVNENFSFE